MEGKVWVSKMGIRRMGDCGLQGEDGDDVGKERKGKVWGGMGRREEVGKGGIRKA